MEARRRRLGMRLSGANAEQIAFRQEALLRSKEELGQSWRGGTMVRHMGEHASSPWHTDGTVHDTTHHHPHRDTFSERVSRRR